MECCEKTNFSSDSVCFAAVRQVADTITGGRILEVTFCDSHTSHNVERNFENTLCTTAACVLQPVPLCFVELANEMFFG